MFISFKSCCTCCKRTPRPLSFWMERVERRILYNAAIGVVDLSLTISYFRGINDALRSLGFVTSFFSFAVSLALYRIVLDKPRPQHVTIQCSIMLLLVAWSLWFTQMVYTITLNDTSARGVPGSLVSMAYFGQGITVSTYYMLFYLQDALDRDRAATHQTSFLDQPQEGESQQASGLSDVESGSGGGGEGAGGDGTSGNVVLYGAGSSAGPLAHSYSPPPSGQGQRGQQYVANPIRYGSEAESPHAYGPHQKSAATVMAVAVPVGSNSITGSGTVGGGAAAVK